MIYFMYSNRVRTQLNRKYVSFLFAYLLLFWVVPALFCQTGFLKIDVEQTDLTVTLNDSLLGVTPLPILELKSGIYEFAISNPYKGLWKHDDWIQKIEIHPADTTVIKPTFKRSLILMTNPFDAQVFFNNQHLGNTPQYFDLPDDKKGQLLILKESYKPFVINLDTVTASTLKIDLTRNIELQRSLAFNTINKEMKIQRHKKLTYSLMALTIASGFASVYLKNQAEKNYNQYLRAGNLKDMNRYYRNAKNFDKYSSVSLGVFEVSFAFSMYLLIKKPEY